MAIRCIALVCSAYKRDTNKQPRFRPHAAVPYDQRILSFKENDHVSLLTLSGRVLVPYVMGHYQRSRFDLKKGQCDVVYRHDGLWFLLVTVDIEEPAPLPCEDVLGVDLGVVRLATDSDGESFSGEEVESVRRRYHNRRQTLQKAAAAKKRRGRRPKNIRRALKRTKRRERNFRRNENHRIAKRIVQKAKGTGRRLALEDLKGIRERTRFPHPQRARFAGWAFAQMRAFIDYKAKLAGLSLVFVDPRDTSRSCADCGHCDKKNRKTQALYWCTACGNQANADINAARNIRARAAVNPPVVSEQRQKRPPTTGTSSVL
jgi:IS605 OrfB family transposase